MRTLSFVIPVYNEEKRLKLTIDALKGATIPHGLKLEEIIFVDDGSKDDTVKTIKAAKASIARKLKAKVHIIAYPRNKGKGYAVRAGMLSTTTDYALFFDADMSTPLSELRKFAEPMRHGVDVVIGTRKNGKSTVIIHQPLYRELLGKCFTLLSQIVLNTWVTDFTCGFKVFSKQAIEDVFGHATINRWGYDAEIVFLAKKIGYKIIQIPVVWSNDPRTKVKIYDAVFQTLKELYEIRMNDFNGVYDEEFKTRVHRISSARA